MMAEVKIKMKNKELERRSYNFEVGQKKQKPEISSPDGRLFIIVVQI